MPSARATFDRAHALISGERRESYGNQDSHYGLSNLAKVWSGILGTDVTAAQVALCMAGLKLVRESASHKEDNLADACGYIGLLAEISKEAPDAL